MSHLRKSIFIVMILLITILTACNSDEGGEAQPTVDLPTPSGQVTFQINGRVLAWVGDGGFPGEHNSNNPGHILLIDGTNRPDIALELPAGTSRVHACGEQATSHDGRYFTFYAGGVTGDIYIMDRQETPRTIAENVNAISCSGSGSLQFSDDSTMLGYLALDGVSTGDERNTGRLNLVRVNNSNPVENFTTPGNVASFDIRENRVAYAQILSAGRNAVVSVWENGDLQELPALAATGSNCSFRTAQVSLTPDNNVAILLGEHCSGNGGGTNWSVHIASAFGGGFTQIVSGESNGSYFPESRTGRIFATQDSAGVYFTVPDGFSRRTVEVNQLIFNDSTQDGWARYATMPRDSTSASVYYDTGTQASPALARDESWWSVIAEDPNDNITIGMFNLVDAEVEPVSISPIFEGEVVSSMAFSPTRPILFYVAGPDSESEEKALYVLGGDGINETLVRGRFVDVIVSPDENFVALTEWQIPELRTQPNYLSLVVVNLTDPRAGRELMFDGAYINEAGRVQNRQFIYPLSWRPANNEDA